MMIIIVISFIRMIMVMMMIIIIIIIITIIIIIFIPIDIFGIHKLLSSICFTSKSFFCSFNFRRSYLFLA